MTKAEAEWVAAGYAWAYEDFTGQVTPQSPGDDRNGSFTFSRAFGQAQADYNEGKSGHMMPVRDAFKTWLVSGGTALDREWRDGELAFLPLPQREEG